MGKFRQISTFLEHLLTDFLQTFYRSSYQEGVGMDLIWVKIRELSTELWHLISVKISFPGSILSIY